MSNETDTASTTAQTTQPGPTLLAERTLSGVFVHLLGAATWFVLPGVVYVASEHGFTRANARNAINWQVLHTFVLVAVFAAFGLSALADSALPGGLPPGVGPGLVYALGAGIYVLGLVFVLNVVFSLVATVKAIFGTAWAYPAAPDVVGWVGSVAGGASRWWIPVAAYALVAPVVFANVLWLALGNDVAFWLTFVLLFATVVASPIVAAALYRDLGHARGTDSSWQPSRTLYVGGPLFVGALTYLARAFLLPSENPFGDATYGFMAALWLASVLYLVGRRRHVGTS